MKKCALFTLIVLAVRVFAATYTVDGYAYLGGETNHTGIKVFFQRIAPDTSYSYTVYSSSTGYYSQVVENGWYDITYSKSSYISQDTTDVALYSNKTLNNITIQKQGLSGSIKGILHAGVYAVTGTLTVEAGDSLTVEPGVKLNFDPGLLFQIYGNLKAEGSEADSIIISNCTIIRFNPYYQSGNAVASLKFCSIRNLSGTKLEINPGPGIIDISNSYIKVSVIWGLYHPEVYFDNVILEGTGTNTCVRLEDSSGISFKYCKILNFSKGIFDPQFGYNSFIVENSLIDAKDIAIESWAGSNFQIYNSIIISDSTAIRTSYNRGNCTIFNSDIISRTGTAIGNSGYAYKIYNSIVSAYNYGIEKYSYDSGTFDVRYSDVRGLSANFYNCGPILGVIVTTNSNGDPCDGYNNIMMDPKFENAASGDFHLLSDSPCIDAGTNTISGYEFPIEDMDGNYRIWDGDGNSTALVDIGAYEYGAPVSALGSPSNMIISVNLNILTINWDSIPNANSYLIYSSDDPYGVFESVGTSGTNTWNTTIDSNTKKFYQVVASSDTVK